MTTTEKGTTMRVLPSRDGDTPTDRTPEPARAFYLPDVERITDPAKIRAALEGCAPETRAALHRVLCDDASANVTPARDVAALEAELATTTDTLHKRTASHTRLRLENDDLRSDVAHLTNVNADLTREAEALRAKVAAVEALHVALGEGDDHWCEHDGFEWPCHTLDALAYTTGEGAPNGANRADTGPLGPDATPDDTERCGGEGK